MGNSAMWLHAKGHKDQHAQGNETNITSEIPSTTYQNKGKPDIGASSHITSLPVYLIIVISKSIFIIWLRKMHF